MANNLSRAVSALAKSDNTIQLRDVNGNYVRGTSPLSRSYGNITTAVLNGTHIIANTDKGKVAVYVVTDNNVYLNSVQG